MSFERRVYRFGIATRWRTISLGSDTKTYRRFRPLEARTLKPLKAVVATYINRDTPLALTVRNEMQYPAKWKGEKVDDSKSILPKGNPNIISLFVSPFLHPKRRIVEYRDGGIERRKAV